ncbi:P-loop containing nucleoside triphosphate hydrolase protein [Phyllosticta capitalensis]
MSASGHQRPKKPLKSYFGDSTEASESSIGEGWTPAPPQRRSRPAEQSNRPPLMDNSNRRFIPGPEEEPEEEELNPGLSERFTQQRPQFDPSSNFHAPRNRIQATSDIKKYLTDTELSVNASSWLSKPEIPTTDEILDENQDGEEEVGLFQNKIEGAWDSKEHYLESHFELIREDAMLPLRQAIGRIRRDPYHPEEVYGTTVGLYEKVHILGVKFSNRGIAVQVEFSLKRVGKQVRWAQSKRLLTGSLVALTTEDDCFRTMCTMATIASRTTLDLDQNPPRIELFFARAEELEIDPSMTFLMVEERSSFLEASRYTLRSLQKLMREPFPMQEHLVEVEQEVSPPKYVDENPLTNLKTVFANGCPERIDILGNWPEGLETELDKTQLKCLQRMLTKRLAIVQGPPGTGKTYVSVVALKVLLENMGDGPPIIVACHTNHALDQLLRHVAQFEPEFARLGARSKDQEVIKNRTLYELRQQERFPNIPGGLKLPAIRQHAELEKEMKEVLEPLAIYNEILSPRTLLQLGILNERQVDSLENPTKKWVEHGATEDDEENANPLERWLGPSSERVERNNELDAFGFDYEEVDLEWEQLREIEAETGVKFDDDEEKGLTGRDFKLGDAIRGKEKDHLDDGQARHLLNEKTDMHRIHKKYRGAVYNYLKRQVKSCVLSKAREIAKKYQDAAIRRVHGYWEEDLFILKKQKIIGMTTTGFSKYRALVSALKPKVVLIEEAAETLEAPVAVTCVPSLEHLILVGDHQQLRPHCQVKDHEDEPYNLNMSLFERLVKNGVEFDTLRRQRRMISEVRRLLQPIYGDLIADHPIVRDLNYRPPVPGMGGINSFFFTHEWQETRDVSMSACNNDEANMIIKFYEYLYLNGIAPENITVLTFYNGQRKLLLQKLRLNPNFQGAGRYFKVVTVDSYQGEENDVVILSLVRSNDWGSVGFLNIKNRVCVALSRARRGFYLFGNGELLACESKIWAQVITIMAGKAGFRLKNEPQMRLGYYLPLMCENHGRKTFLAEPEDFESLHGGCEIRCTEKLPCGHACHLRCHPFPHDSVVCARPCNRTLPCGHRCQEICSDPCQCQICVRTTGSSTAFLKPGTHLGLDKKETKPSPPSPKSSPGPSPRQRIASPAEYEAPEAAGAYATAWQQFPANVRQHDADFAAERAREHEQREAEAAAEAERDELERAVERMVFGDADNVPPPTPAVPSPNRVVHRKTGSRVCYTDTWGSARGPSGGPGGAGGPSGGAGGAAGASRRGNMNNSSQSEKSLLD